MHRLWITAVLSCLASIAVTALMTTLTAPVHLVGNFLMLRLSENAGIAFGIPLPVEFGSLLIVIVLAIVVVLSLTSARDRLSSLAFGFIIGGAVGNLFDRIADGRVTDYFVVGTFPVFNAADACISIGAGLLIVDALLKPKKRPAFH